MSLNSCPWLDQAAYQKARRKPSFCKSEWQVTESSWHARASVPQWWEKSLPSTRYIKNKSKCKGTPPALRRILESRRELSQRTLQWGPWKKYFHLDNITAALNSSCSPLLLLWSQGLLQLHADTNISLHPHLKTSHIAFGIQDLYHGSQHSMTA